MAEAKKQKNESSAELSIAGAVSTSNSVPLSLESESKINYSSELLAKNQKALSSPARTRYESTSNTSHCDEEETQEWRDNRKLRMKLKRRVQLECDEDYDMVLHLLNLRNKRQKTS